LTPILHINHTPAPGLLIQAGGVSHFEERCPVAFRPVQRNRSSVSARTPAIGPAATLPMSRDTHESVHCSARSSQTGEPCKRWASHGTTVCTSHGAAAPQVKLAAEERIRALVDPALTRLANLIDHADNDSVRLAAVRDVLDRAGYAAKQQIEITIRRRAAQLADELGLDPDELIAEAERIVASAG
jgi:hypothetical protein